jgi:hypothetical protein
MAALGSTCNGSGGRSSKKFTRVNKTIVQKNQIEMLIIITTRKTLRNLGSVPSLLTLSGP